MTSDPSDRRYERPPDLDRPAIEAGLLSPNSKDQVQALHAAAFNEADSGWALSIFLAKLRSGDLGVRQAAASLLTSLIQMRRIADSSLKEELRDVALAEPDLAARLEEAVQLLDLYTK